MQDWSAEDLARAIERRRGRPRRAKGLVRDAPSPPSAVQWTEADWASQFTFLHGYTTRVRGVTQVCIRDSDGAVLWEGGVREIALHAAPWLGFAWMVRVGDQLRFESALASERVRTAEEAVRTRL
ncbi:MAG: hypothetical protein AB7O98_03200 [Hyphomonadaceae bacterium]